MTKNGSERKGILFQVFLFCLLAFCASCSTMRSWEGSGGALSEDEQALCQELQKLSVLAQKVSDSPFRQICLAKEGLRRCQELAAEGGLTPRDRRNLAKRKTEFERMLAMGEILLSRQACLDSLSKERGGYDLLRGDLQKLVEVVERHSRNERIWKVEEQEKMALGLNVLKTALVNLEKGYAFNLEECRKRLEGLRIDFENALSVVYMNNADQNYLRQERKWFNWGWLGHWRDDLSALYQGMDHCQRVVESQYVSSQIKNRAHRRAELIRERFSRKEAAFYQKKHINEVKAIRDVDGYPQDDTERTAKEMAWQSFRERRGRNSDAWKIVDLWGKEGSDRR